MPKTIRPVYALPASDATGVLLVGIERARVADAALAVDPAQARDDVVRRAARRLVDDDETVMHLELA